MTNNRVFISGTVHTLPACEDWKGRKFPARFGVSLVTRGRSMRIDGGEFPTREEAVAAIAKATGRA